MTQISKQQIMDCTWGSGNHGCRGGFPAKALEWVIRNGVATKKSYGPYLGQVSNFHTFIFSKYTLILDFFFYGFAKKIRRQVFKKI